MIQMTKRKPDWLSVGCGRPLFVTMLLLGVGSACGDEPATEQAAASSTVELTIDFGDGFHKRYPTIPVVEKMTVADALRFAAEHTHATQFATRGKNQTAFLESIDGIANEGYGKRCWIFYVNGKKAEQSYGTVNLTAGDTVLWRFQTFP